jgi:hypothetical protein
MSRLMRIESSLYSRSRPTPRRRNLRQQPSLPLSPKLLPLPLRHRILLPSHGKRTSQPLINLTYARSAGSRSRRTTSREQTEGWGIRWTCTLLVPSSINSSRSSKLIQIHHLHPSVYRLELGTGQGGKPRGGRPFFSHAYAFSLPPLFLPRPHHSPTPASSSQAHFSLTSIPLPLSKVQPGLRPTRGRLQVHERLLRRVLQVPPRPIPKRRNLTRCLLAGKRSRC